MLGRGVPRGQEQGSVAGLPEPEPWVDGGPRELLSGASGPGPYCHGTDQGDDEGTPLPRPRDAVV